MKYKIKVSRNWIFDDIEAESWEEAKHKAVLLASEQVDADNMIAERYSEPINWREQAKEEGKALAEDLEDDTKRLVYKWQSENENNALKKDENEAVADIFDELCQKTDITSQAMEYADGQFIYLNTAEAIEALQAINELHEWEETDNGLWGDSQESQEEQINAKATYTYSNAIYSFAEEAIKERITELLAAKE